MCLYTITKLINIIGYKVSEIISITAREIRVRIEAEEGHAATCSECGEVHQEGYHSSKEMVAEGLRLGERRLFLHILKRRYRCPQGKGIRTEEISWIEGGSRVTKAFAKEVSRLTAITTNKEAGWYLGLDDEKVYRIDKAILEEQAHEKLNPPPGAANISVDEVSYRKHHRYLTNVIDVDEKVLIWNSKGRRAEVLDKYYKAIGQDNCQGIESVALDGAKTYISSSKKYAVNALIVLDRFHASQKVNGAVDRVRKEELAKARKNEDDEIIQLTNCKQRFVLLKKKSHLTERQSCTLKKLCEINEPIYKAMLLKELFLQVYECKDIIEAEEHLNDWIQQARESSLEAFKELAKSIKEKAQYILNWFNKKTSSAISEGFNNKIKRLKRMAYGYKDIEYFKLKIHQHCGLLNPRRFAT
jgi:transposase